jgi:protease-4
MRFIGKVWRLLVGIKDGLVLLFMLLFFGLLFAALSASPNAGSIAEGALLLDIKGAIVEQPEESSATDVLTGSSAVSTEGPPPRRRPRTRCGGDRRSREGGGARSRLFLGGGQATLNDVAAALGRVRRANKPVLAYATGYSDDAYLLAAQASEIWLNPMGAVLVTGPGGTNL